MSYQIWQNAIGNRLGSFTHPCGNASFAVLLGWALIGAPATAAENDMKWQHIHPREGADGYAFGPADAFVAFGEKHGLERVGHTLVWHNQTADWEFSGTNAPPEPAAPAGKVVPGNLKPVYAGPRASREELLERMSDHIHTVVGRYKGRVKTWDVVNEVLS